MDGTKGREAARWSQSQKAVLSSDWSLQLDSMKSESLVIVDQHATVNTYLSLVLPARHTLGVVCSGSILDVFIFYLYFENTELM